MLTVPNVISAARIVGSVVMLWLAYAGLGRTEDALREYLRLFVKVPFLGKIGPLAPVKGVIHWSLALTGVSWLVLHTV